MVVTSLILLFLSSVGGQDQCSGEACGNQSKRRICTRADKKLFNENLIHLFRTEYGKEFDLESDVHNILIWKFENLDRNDDSILQRAEYKPLKRLKKVVKPKRCAKVFAKACDRDNDQQISKLEWSNCLGMTLAAFRTAPMVGLLEYRKRKEEPEANDCISDRQAVLSEQRDHQLYVPECSTDGRYRQVQCYRSTGYCWCVHEDDGKPIPGTSVKDKLPDCDSVPAPQRPMKGCPPILKEKFIDDLFAFQSRNVSVNEEQLSTKMFSNLDANGSKYLEKNEWKAFRTLVAAHKPLRRCGKRLPKYCDVNSDRRISMTEWTNCLGVSADHRRRGPNPIETILKDD